jgi:GNAT superfamily N-acetyltransferase
MFVAGQSGAAETTSFVVRLKLEIAVPTAIASLRVAAAEKLTAVHGPGPWSGKVSEKGMLFAMRNSTVYVARRRGKLIATLTLCTKKPWSIDKKYFSACNRPLYLTAMAVAPELQSQGIGRLCIEAAKMIVKQWPADAIRLDAYDAAVGAGEFYRKCGFREVGRASYRCTPLIYFEMLV